MKASPLTLEALNKKIKNLIKGGLDSYWVIGEISELKVNYSGHCYLELIQKSETTEQLVARARSVIWANTYRMLHPYFETTTGQVLTDGIKVMVRVIVEFHEVYGLSLNIVDIEPTYTVGEVAIRKQKILEKLNAEGVLEMNRELELPYLTNRIAVISSKTAAGLGDFMDQLHDNPYGYKFYVKLFPATMQGNEAESSIIGQCDKIYNYIHLFDTVVLIRGGGATADLDCFNSYWLAYNITQFPIPVLTGIGHEQDDTVVDIVANTRLKTPTAVAEFLIDRMVHVDTELTHTETEIAINVRSIISEKKEQLSNVAQRFKKVYSNRVTVENKRLTKLIINYVSSIKNSLFLQHKNINRNKNQLYTLATKQLNNENYRLKLYKQKIANNLRLWLEENKHSIKQAEQAVILNNPMNILNKGYSITLKDGKSVKNASVLKNGDIIETIFASGKKKSEVK